MEYLNQILDGEDSDQDHHRHRRIPTWEQNPRVQTNQLVNSPRPPPMDDRLEEKLEAPEKKTKISHIF